MIIIPAIDIIDGKAVRLYQGDYDKKDNMKAEVLEIAKEFKEAGAKLIHLVDLDGAKEGRLINKDLILKVVNTINIDVEVGGGIRTFEDIKSLIDGGVKRVILGTAAIEDKVLLKKAVEKFKEKIAVAIDFKDGFIHTKGWLNKSEIYYKDLIKELEVIGVKNIIVTDITKDGTLLGPNIEIMKELSEFTSIDITSSGGIKNLDNIIELNKLNIYGCIVGKAIYSKDVNLKEAISYIEYVRLCILKE